MKAEVGRNARAASSHLSDPRPSSIQFVIHSIADPTVHLYLTSRLLCILLLARALRYRYPSNSPSAPSITSQPRTAHSFGSLDSLSKLFVVAPRLGAFYNLASLDLSDNTTESARGVYTTLGSISHVELSRIRLEIFCGREWLRARKLAPSRLQTALRLAAWTPSNITNISIEGNPLTEPDDEHRTRCFEPFLKGGETITLSWVHFLCAQNTSNRARTRTQLESRRRYIPPALLKLNLLLLDKAHRRKPTRIVDIDDIPEKAQARA